MDRAKVKLADYEAKLAWFRCGLCKRFTSRDRYALKREFEGTLTMGEIARHIAAMASPPCRLSALGGPMCRAYPERVPVEQWAIRRTP